MSVDQLHTLAEQLHGQPVPGITMTEGEFVDWCDEDIRAEWVDGRIYIMSPSNIEHDELQIWLIRLLGELVERTNAGAIYQNIFVRFAAKRRRRVPDLMFLAKKNLARLTPTFLEGPPDLLMEIVSPDSQSRDRREKYFEYEELDVREYWIIDPISKRVEAVKLEQKGFVPIEPVKGVVASTVLAGLKLDIESLWRKPLPRISVMLRKMSKG